MKIKEEKNYIYDILLILINIYSFFGYLFSRTLLLIFICFISLILFMQKNNSIDRRIIRYNGILIFFLFYISFGLFYTPTFSLTAKFIITFSAILLIKIFFESLNSKQINYDWEKKYMNYSAFFSFIHVLSTYFMNFFPTLALKFNYIILSPTQYSQNLLQHTQGLNAGICDIYGINAFFVLIFSGLMVVKVFSSEKLKIKEIILLIIGVIALVLVGKRGALLCFLIGFLTCFLISFKKISFKKKILMIISFTFVILGIIFLMSKIPSTNILITRLNQSSTKEGILSGREILYQRSISTFKNNFLFGVGIKGIYGLFSQDGHNIYLQLLAETGIIGSAMIFYFFTFSIVNSIKIYKLALKTKNTVTIEKKLYSIFYQICFLTYGITENSFYLESLLILYLLCTSFNYDKSLKEIN